MIETREIKMPHKKMLRMLFTLHSTPWILVTIGGLVIFSFIGVFFSYKFFFLAIIWLFIVIPLCFSFLYFFYGMSPLTAFNTIPHKIKIKDSKMLFTFSKLHDEDPSSEQEQFSEYEETLDSFSNIRCGSDYVILSSTTKKGWVWIPVSSFNSHDEFKIFMSNLPSTLLSPLQPTL